MTLTHSFKFVSSGLDGFDESEAGNNKKRWLFQTGQEIHAETQSCIDKDGHHTSRYEELLSCLKKIE